MTWPCIDHGMLSPNGRVSKRSRKVAMERVTEMLFPEGFPKPQHTDTRSEREVLLHRAKELRELVARGMHVRKYAKEAARLEALADAARRG